MWSLELYSYDKLCDLEQGLETVAALSHSINYENVATEAFRSVKHLSTNWDKSKGARSPKSIIV